ncbi:OmpA family protein [Entomospira culicis]|uniref:OmpA family protein n=1 Tax=Entomospira culicis TaxID=2719989 RepID=A0A968GH34_9SPIO|nr:OmpA family protein [Entomospira culicis]NIZ19389.1 OmpA family protein [Entomospira culicis]NIZ69706.1 OmpA family protein [Entomospira culicis]WDI36816.1 OmpA family protein [Entomospira culicis]WDI38445.1 OmpA family protein [Entomospira culicis]
MALAKKERKKIDPNGWLLTYGDMITLVLCFFVLLIGEPAQDSARMQLLSAAMGGLGPFTGGQTLDEGPLALMGSTVNALPSSQRKNQMGAAKAQAQHLQSQDQNNLIQQVVEDPERGLVITLAGDVLFAPDSVELDIERNRRMLQELAILLNSPELAGMTYRVEGHTDSVSPEFISREFASRFRSNWDVSTARAINVLQYLVDYGAPESRMQVTGFAGTRPIVFGDDPESRAYNRRVEIVVLTRGHL